MDLEYVVPAAVPVRHGEGRAFANSVIVEDKSATFEDGTPMAQSVRLRFFALTTSLVYALVWQAGDVLLVDNSRIMHGRHKIALGAIRRIVLRTGREI